jgi:hypothetical protein
MVTQKGMERVTQVAGEVNTKTNSKVAAGQNAEVRRVSA